MSKRNNGRKNDLISMPRTLGGDPNRDEELDDGLGGDDESAYDDGLDAAGDDATDDDLDDGLDDAGDDDDGADDDYDVSGEVNALRARNAQLEAQMLGAGTGGTDGDLDLSDLPDVVTKPEEFKKKLGEKVNGAVKAITARTTQSMTQQEVTNNVRKLEQDFRRMYPKLSKKSALLQAATTQEANAIRARGLDPANVMFGQSDKFLKKVAARMNAELGIEDRGNENLMRRRAQQNGRTRGVSSGTRMPGVTKKGTQDNGKPMPLVKQILQHQQKMGLI